MAELATNYFRSHTTQHSEGKVTEAQETNRFSSIKIWWLLMISGVQSFAQPSTIDDILMVT